MPPDPKKFWDNVPKEKTPDDTAEDTDAPDVPPKINHEQTIEDEERSAEGFN